ncbi:MAG TPA: biopolymer transporter ExbD [bacterium]|nr:biopolymer transporter ExbD [bacterium]
MAITGPQNNNNHDDAIFAEINITPLTDIFLVLLIIFMVTTTTIVMQGTNVNLPTSSKSAGQPTGIIITVTKENQIMVNDKETSLAGLEGVIAEELVKAKDKTAILRADRLVNLGEVIKVMTAAQKSGANKLAILTTPDDEKP